MYLTERRETISVTELVENSNFDDFTLGQSAKFSQPLALCPTMLQSALCFNLNIDSCDSSAHLLKCCDATCTKTEMIWMYKTFLKYAF